MSLVPSLLALFAALMLLFAAGRSLQDTGLLMAQQASRLLAMQRAQLRLDQAAPQIAGELTDADASDVAIETLPTADRAELQDLPIQLQRVTAVGESGSVRVRVQADFVVDGCESEHDHACTPRVRQIAWRPLSAD